MANAVLEKPRSREAGEELCPICGLPRESCPRETHVFVVDNLDCAHCAAQMEDRIAHLADIDDVSLTYTTRQLRVTCAHPLERIGQFQDACASVDADAIVRDAPDHGAGRMVASGVVETPAGSCSCSHDHDHAHSHEHAHENVAVSAEAATRDEQDEDEGGSSDLVCIIVSAVLFAVGVVCEHLVSMPLVSIAVFVAAYLVAGGEVLLHAARNLRHGRVFDENFLMCVATFGAFAVQEFPEAVGVMLFYRVGEYFEDRAVERSRSQIIGAVDLRPETVSRLVGPISEPSSAVPASDGLSLERRVEEIPAGEAAVGDHVLVRPGDRIPLDGAVVEGSSTLDTSPVTGESAPVAVQEGQEVLSGCVNQSGLLVLRVSRPLSESMVSRILESVENAAANKPHIERFISRFARVYTPVVIAIAVLTALVPSFVTGDWMHWVYTACTFLVISCPCALVLSVPLAYFSGIGAASKLGILFKGGSSMEALKDVRAVVMDKTGTITSGTFSLRAVHPAAGYSETQVLAAAASAEQTSTHPIARSIVQAANARGLVLSDVAALQETAGLGVSASLAGPQGSRVLCGNRPLLEDEGVSVPADVPDALVLVAIDGSYAGALEAGDVEKPDSADAISALRDRGIHPVMLTGDAPDSAERMARRVGIDDVHARLLPTDKLAALQQVRSEYGPSLFVGDGINDAPVLAGADVGAAMGSGADAAIEAADVVFMNSNLSAVPQSLHIARVVGAIAMENIVFALVVKAAVLVLGIAGFASMWAAVFADVGVAMLCVLNSIRVLHRRF